MTTQSRTIPPPATPNWRSADATDDKAALLPIGWGESAETHLWYDIGRIKELSRQDRKALMTMFFTQNAPGQIHVVMTNRIIGGSNALLHVHGTVTLHPSVCIQGANYPLYQYGGSEPLKDPSAIPNDVINFAAKWS